MAGHYQIGPEVNGRLEIQREGKSSLYLPLDKLISYEASGEVEVQR